MAKKYSLSWKASSRPAKQRKFRAHAPLHIRGRFMSSTLSKDLRKKYGTRNVTIRLGDEVLVMRGQFRGKKAKVERVDMKRLKIYLSKIEVSKKDGTKTALPIDPSNVMIISPNTDDKKRFKNVGKNVKSSVASGEKSEKQASKPALAKPAVKKAQPKTE